MSKVSKEGTSKLLRLLYDSTAGEARRRVPVAVKYMYQTGSAINGSEQKGLEQNEQGVDGPSTEKSINSKSKLYNETYPKSVLDNLLENDWNQKPLDSAVSCLPKTPDTAVASNVLMLRCPNSLLVNSDFYNLYPVQRERMFSLPQDLKHGIKFSVIKGRNPRSLAFRNCYYMVFPSYTHAAAYWLETRNKSVNGFPWKLRFVNVAEHVEYMSSPWLDFAGDKGPVTTQNMSKVTFKSSPHKYELLETLKTRSFDSDTTDGHNTPYDIITKFIDFDTRNSCVLVKNLPFGLSKHALPRLLWDFEFPEQIPTSSCFVPIVRDPLSQINITLIRFQDHGNAQRFVRSFHGKKWHGFRSGADKEKFKRLYEPLLCEIVN